MTTVAVFIFVPNRAHHHKPFYIENEHGTYKTAMILLLISNIVTLVGENIDIFRKKISIKFSALNRIIAFVISTPLLITTLIVTENSHGKELVWLLWLTISISFSVAQMINLFFLVVLECYNSSVAIKTAQTRS
jgi:hypothetical protein